MVKDTINQLIMKTAEELGYSVYGSSLYLKGENSKITVKIDRPEGISHQDCERYSRDLARMLDDADVLPNYSLEVSSPGFKREIRNSEEFRRFIDSPVKVLYDNGDKREVVRGIIKSVSDTAMILTTEKDDMEISMDCVVNANLDY